MGIKIVGIFCLILLIPNSLAMLNSAAVYCESLGYKYVIERTEAGERGCVNCQMGKRLTHGNFWRVKLHRNTATVKRWVMKLKL